MAIQIKNRTIPGDQVRDPSTVELLTYNEKSGARKSLRVGPVLLPIPDGAGGYTTDATTRRALPAPGTQLAIWNKSNSTDYSVTIGDSTVTSQAIGVVQAATQFVGVACKEEEWTYISSGAYSYVITSNANLVVYMIDDPTYIVTQPANNAST